MKKIVLLVVAVACCIGLFFGPSEEELHAHDISAEETAKLVNNKINANKVNRIIEEEKEKRVWSYK